VHRNYTISLARFSAILPNYGKTTARFRVAFMAVKTYHLNKTKKTAGIIKNCLPYKADQPGNCEGYENRVSVLLVSTAIWHAACGVVFKYFSLHCC
jgi:hypothetical protein